MYLEHNIMAAGMVDRECFVTGVYGAPRGCPRAPGPSQSSPRASQSQPGKEERGGEVKVIEFDGRVFQNEFGVGKSCQI